MNSLRPKLLERAELIVCVMASLAAIWLHLVFLTHAGALWRDEVGSVQFATMLPLGEMCRKLAYESFPVCFPVLVRVWAALGLGGNDFTLRLLGFLMGLGLLGAVWLNARLMGSRWPLITLGLLAANLTVVRWGDSLRAYGCGSLAILLSLGLTWRLVRAPGRASFLLAALAAILSVQTLYQNAFLLLAASLAGCMVCARCRQWKSIALVLGVGLIAAASLLPYVPGMRASNQSFRMIEKTGFDPGWVWFNLGLATGSPYDWQATVWVIVLLLAAVAGLTNAWRGKGAGSDLPLFAVTSMVLGTGLFMLFIWMSGLPTQVWYLTCRAAGFCRYLRQRQFSASSPLPSPHPMGRGDQACPSCVFHPLPIRWGEGRGEGFCGGLCHPLSSLLHPCRVRRPDRPGLLPEGRRVGARSPNQPGPDCGVPDSQGRCGRCDCYPPLVLRGDLSALLPRACPVVYRPADDRPSDPALRRAHGGHAWE